MQLNHGESIGFVASMARFVVGSSFEESFLNQVQGPEWPAADNEEWIPPTQLDELVRRVDEACKKSKRNTPQRECAVPALRPQSSFMSKTVLINIKKALRRGAGRARGSITAGFTSPVSEQYFMRFWWERRHQSAAKQKLPDLDRHIQRSAGVHIQNNWGNPQLSKVVCSFSRNVARPRKSWTLLFRGLRSLQRRARLHRRPLEVAASA